MMRTVIQKVVGLILLALLTGLWACMWVPPLNPF
jgi:hypothetical protein